MGKENKLLAVEANPALMPILEQNIIKNNHTNVPVDLLNCAIDYSYEEIVSFSATKDFLMGKLTNYEGCECKKDGSYNVEAVKLCDLVARINTEKYILIVDIEGAEVGMFVDDKEALKNCYRIIAEIDGGFYKGEYYGIEKIIDLLMRYGFYVLHRHANRIVLENSRITGNDGFRNDLYPK